MSRHPSKAAERRPASTNDEAITIGLDKSIHVNLGRLGAPQNRYDADYAWIEYRAAEASASFMFAKRSRQGEDTPLRTRLEVRYPIENLEGHFWSNSRRFHRELAAYVALWPPRPQTADDRTQVHHMTASKDHSVWANVEAISHAGSEATIDFYALGTTGIAKFTRGGPSADLTIEPVVRVQLSVFELLRLLDDTTPVIDAIRAQLPDPAEVAKLKETRG